MTGPFIRNAIEKAFGPIARQYPIGTLSLAYGCILGYFSIETFSFTLFPQSSALSIANLDFFLFWSTLFTALFALSGVALEKVFNWALDRFFVPFVAAAFLACCPLISLTVNEGFLPAPFLFVDAIAFAMGAIFFRIAFVKACVPLQTKDAFIALCFANIIGSLIYFMAISIPLTMRIVLLSLIPFLTAACFTACKEQNAQQTAANERTGENGRGHLSKARRQATIALLVLTPLILIASTTARLSLFASQNTAELAGQWQETLFWMTCLSAILVLLAFTPAFEEGQILTRFFYSAILVVLLFFFVAPFANQPLPSAAAICGALGNMMDLVVTVICIQIIRKWSQSPVRAFSLIVGSACLGRFCSHALFATDAQYAETFGAPLIFVVDFLIIAAAVMLLTSKEFPELLSDPSNQTGKNAEPNEPTSSNAVLENASLTPKQTEVAALLLKGYTIRLIAEELCCSESTVKAHVHQIYLKTETSSREELIKKCANS